MASVGPKALVLLIQLFILASLFTPHTSALKCNCTFCADDSCVVSPNKESRCYLSFKVDRRPDGTPYLDKTYGCLSASEGSLGLNQCKVPGLENMTLAHIMCCNDQDYCNENLPGPPEDDPIWEYDDPSEADANRIFGITTTTIYIITLGLVVAFLLTSYVMPCILRWSRRSKDDRSSTCSLKADLEKFHQKNGSSTSTRSYSISDDLCHRIQEQSSHDEIESIPDFTSGLGSQTLNTRTMARAVKSGETAHVGDGRYGRVFRGQYHGEDVAVKAFKTIDSSSWQREDKILRLLNHANIVRIIASEATPVDGQSTEIWMFLEYCLFGSLCDYLDHNEILGPQQAVKILYSIIDGLNYLHEDFAQASRLYKPSIAHRDIKSKNILMRSPDVCCIADFGHALIQKDEGALDFGIYKHLQVGTVRYMAPEILRPDRNLDYGEFITFAQADLYQYGLVLWEVCQRTSLDVLHPAGPHKLPFDEVVPPNPEIQDMVKIVCDDKYRPQRSDKWQKYPMMKQLADLMTECWRPNSKARMQTLGVKKRMRELYDQIIPQPSLQFQLNILHNYSLSPNSRIDRDKTRSFDATL